MIEVNIKYMLICKLKNFVKNKYSVDSQKFCNIAIYSPNTGFN
jgi:hypothetical protein